VTGAIRAGFAAAAMLPLAVSAELSNDSMLGLGVRTRPAYDGAASQRSEIVPVVRYLGEPWFLRSTQGVLETGARVELGSGLHAGVQLAYEAGRRSRESAFLQSHQVADIDRGASFGLQLEWDHAFGPMPVALLVRTRQQTESNLGSQVDVRLSAGAYQSGAFGAGLFAQSSWSSTKSASAYYGLDAPASAIAGLPAFQPGSGWLYASVGLLWSLRLGPQWDLVGNLEARRLLGDAARSPLVERRLSGTATAGLASRF
jgi:outer membrane protein